MSNLFNREQIKNEAKRKMRGNFGVALLLLFITVIINAGFGLVVNVIEDSTVGVVQTIVILVTTVVTILVGGATELANTDFYLWISKGASNVGVMESIKYGFRHMRKAGLASLMVTISVLLGTVLFIIPGILIALRYSFVFYVIAENPDMTVLEAMKRCGKITSGRKLNILGFGISFILWYIAIGVTFGLAGLYAIPYISEAKAVYYNKLVEEYRDEIDNREYI